MVRRPVLIEEGDTPRSEGPRPDPAPEAPRAEARTEPPRREAHTGARSGPRTFEEPEGPPRPGPADAPPVPDDLPDVRERPSGQAMRTMAALAARPRSSLGKWFWRMLGATFVFMISVATWAAIDAMLARSVILGYAATVLVAGLGITVLGLVARELRALARLGRVAHLQKEAARVVESRDVKAARVLTDHLVQLYAARPELDWHRARLKERAPEQFDADALMGLAERELLAPLDMAARIEVEAASRQVAAVTAVVPLAFADVAAALVSNLRMIRRIAEIYGGRAGTIGAWRLTRAVFTHLVATGAVAVGDDLIGSVAGGSVLARVSRRFGEGIVNGALTARVGIAAMEVCRPLPFVEAEKPQVHRLIGRSLSGLFPQSKGD